MGVRGALGVFSRAREADMEGEGVGEREASSVRVWKGVPPEVSLLQGVDEGEEEAGAEARGDNEALSLVGGEGVKENEALRVLLGVSVAVRRLGDGETLTVAREEGVSKVAVATAVDDAEAEMEGLGVEVWEGRPAVTLGRMGVPLSEPEEEREALGERLVVPEGEALGRLDRDPQAWERDGEAEALPTPLRLVPLGSGEREEVPPPRAREGVSVALGEDEKLSWLGVVKALRVALCVKLRLDVTVGTLVGTSVTFADFEREGEEEMEGLRVEERLAEEETQGVGEGRGEPR